MPTSKLFNLALIIQIFVLINPLSSFPVLMAAHKKQMNVRAITLEAIILAFVIAILIALVGPFMFDFFGVTIDSFRIAGGIILLLLGIDTIRSSDGEDSQVTTVDSLISIIATPLLTGPATISFITIKSYEIGKVPLISAIVPAFVLAGIIFVVFSFTIKKINPKVVNISSKVFGLFLAALAVEMMAVGIHNLLVKQ